MPLLGSSMDKSWDEELDSFDLDAPGVSCFGGAFGSSIQPARGAQNRRHSLEGPFEMGEVAVLEMGAEMPVLAVPVCHNPAPETETFSAPSTAAATVGGVLTSSSVTTASTTTASITTTTTITARRRPGRRIPTVPQRQQPSRNILTPIPGNARGQSNNLRVILLFFVFIVTRVIIPCLSIFVLLFPLADTARTPAIPSPSAASVAAAAASPPPVLPLSSTHAKSKRRSPGPGRPPCPHLEVTDVCKTSTACTTGFCADQCGSKLKICNVCGTWQNYKYVTKQVCFLFLKRVSRHTGDFLL